MSCKREAYANAPLILMGRVNGLAEVPLVQADVDSISYRVFAHPSADDAEHATNAEEIGEAAALNVAATIFDELQTDPPWDVDRDGDGYNFRFTLPAARRPTGNRWHRIQVTITPSAPGEEPFPVVFIVFTKALAGS
jgi:hypothetical protein